MIIDFTSFKEIICLKGTLFYPFFHIMISIFVLWNQQGTGESKLGFQIIASIYNILLLFFFMFYTSKPKCTLLSFGVQNAKATCSRVFNIFLMLVQISGSKGSKIGQIRDSCKDQTIARSMDSGVWIGYCSSQIKEGTVES